MRSEFRCSEHFQGDYCTKIDGHGEMVHVGKYNKWVIRENGPERIKHEESFNELVGVLAGV